MEAIARRLPAPDSRRPEGAVKAMLIDAWYDTYMGVVVLFRVMEGTLKKGSYNDEYGRVLYGR